jgi:hypothetical protein
LHAPSHRCDALMQLRSRFFRFFRIIADVYAPS